MPRSLLAAACAVLSLAACRREAGPGASAPDGPLPQRIVAGSVFAAEVLLDLVARERLVGVHVVAADPRYSLVAARVEGLPLVAAEPEAVLALRPDLVVLDAYTRPETAALLTAAGVRLLRPPEARSFDDVWANVRLLGAACGCEPRAEELVAAAEERLRRLREGAAERARWGLLGLDGALHTYGNGSLFDAVVGAAGARNLAIDLGVGSFRRLDVETVLSLPIDAIVLAVPREGVHRDELWITQHPGLQLLACVRRDRLLCVPGPLLASTSHHLVGAAEFVAATIDRWGSR